MMSMYEGKDGPGSLALLFHRCVAQDFYKSNKLKNQTGNEEYSLVTPVKINCPKSSEIWFRNYT